MKVVSCYLEKEAMDALMLILDKEVVEDIQDCLKNTFSKTQPHPLLITSVDDVKECKCV